MEQHPVPRQITTFEFKLIGFMTIRQFGYVILGGVFGYAAFLIVPIFILNYIAGILLFCASLAFAFFRVNDRPLDVFVRNLYTRVNSPTQYTFHKNNPVMGVMDDLYFESNPHVTLAHADSREKLSAYLIKKNGQQLDPHDRSSAIGRINTVFAKKDTHAAIPKPARAGSPPPPPPPPTPPGATPNSVSTTTTPTMTTPQIPVSGAKHPFFSGTVTNTRNIPLPGVLVYIKDTKTGKSLRILKTNPHGVFATFNPLPPNTYVVEVVDSSANYHFDTREITLDTSSAHVFTFTSKEMV